MKKLKKFLTWIKADRKRLIGVVIIAILLVFGVNRISSVNNNKVSYQTTKVTRGTFVSSVSASGQILTSNLVNVSSLATGVVKEIYVNNGDHVNKGELLAEIIPDSDGALANAKAWAGYVSAQNAVNAANNNYRSTQASLENIYDQVKGHDTDETFVQKEVRTKAEVANDNAFDALKTASANFALASITYRQSSSRIVAPVSGVVDNITIASTMNLVATSSPNRIAVITLPNSVPLATVNVSEVDVSTIVPGQKVTITLDSISEKSFTGKVVTVDKIGTVVSGVTNYPVVIAFDSSSPEILPNMAITVDIIVETKADVLLVPASAVQIIKETANVRILKNNQLEIVEVKVGNLSDTQAEIISGLSEGDSVVTAILTGSLVRPGATSPFSTFRVGGR